MTEKLLLISVECTLLPFRMLLFIIKYWKQSTQYDRHVFVDKTIIKALMGVIKKS